MVVVHNMLAMNAQRQLGINTKRKAKSTEKLASGYKINKAADNSASLAISEKMRKQIRGLSQASENCQDGISLVQVADGALNETHEILQRLNELAVKSANGTNSESDRAAINEEKKELIYELNRIANTTSFNEDIYPLLGGNRKGLEVTMPTKKFSLANVLIDDIKLIGSGTISNKVAETYVGWSPFQNVKDYDAIRLQAVIDDKQNIYSTDTYNLIYGNGSTSHSKIRLTDANAYITGSVPEQYEVNMSDFTYDLNSYNFDSSTKTWTRSFSWTSDNGNIGAKVTQKVQIDDANKNYIITNEITSTGSNPAFFEFMVNLDTAYNNNDRCEGYYTNGTELENYSIYNTATSKNALFQEWLDTSMSPYIYDDSYYPDSISITNRDFRDLLPFTEKITFTGDKPVISIGDYHSKSAEWDYFKTTGPAEHLGQNAIGTDRTTTLIWSTGNTVSDLSSVQQGNPYSFTFTVGVDSVRKDTNLPPTQNLIFKTIEVPDPNADPVIKEIYQPGQLRIQAGASSAAADGIYIHLVNATAESLGVADIDLSTAEGSCEAINCIKEAIETTSRYRSYFGAVQNRMEHTILNLDNVVENTQDAESTIRDTDMASEMVQYTKDNIMFQAGLSILTQANQSKEGVLSLLQ